MSDAQNKMDEHFETIQEAESINQEFVHTQEGMDEIFKKQYEESNEELENLYAGLGEENEQEVVNHNTEIESFDAISKKLLN